MHKLTHKQLLGKGSLGRGGGSLGQSCKVPIEATAVAWKSTRQRDTSSRWVRRAAAAADAFWASKPHLTCEDV